ncbi:cystathionine gamma-synthase [Longimicrobium sp.]|uniref:cystathionine gamma-synthase n=1 Tax=Longimicrobium sp. TaxID=2029185 RepID=UPI002B7A5C9B|nr:cystathionine gamma-synthase [Longimicrobium sp.]HSU12648.1 cystathionine gamma-synthase [Longimicrobium sp.]
MLPDHRNDTQNLGFGTRAIHAGQRPDPTTGAIMTPVYQTSTYVQPELGRHLGYEYARTHNPTREALEGNLASLEGGKHGLSFASGLAATDTLMKLFSAGDHIVCGENVYGGTYRLFNQVISRMGIEFSFVDSSSVDAIRAALRPNTKLVHVETPTNPMMGITDIPAAAEVVHAAGALLSVDNTFASPYNQQPLALGADVVMHSVTKYLNGHSDMVGGVLVVNDDEIHERLRFLQNAAGGVPGPWDCWLVLRSTKTLHVRMAAHNANGLRIAQWLTEQPKIEKVYYPGLPSHPQHELAARQMRGFTGMITVETGSLEAARKFVNGVRIFSLAESLGGVESLIGHPASQTHASIPAERRNAMGLTDGIVRLSCGIEDVDDLIADLEQALAAV